MFFHVVKELCKSNGVTLSHVLLELGMSKANATHWKSGKMPSSTNLKKLADYFGKSTDFLLAGSNCEGCEKMEERRVLIADPAQVEVFYTEIRKAVTPLLDELCINESRRNQQMAMLAIGTANSKIYKDLFLVYVTSDD